MVLHGFHSDYSNIGCGVPRGSVLGPLLFLIYINDLERNIRSNVKFFSDDTMLFLIVEDPLISANILNHELETIYQWGHQWKMAFYPDPTEQATEILFSCKKVSPQLMFNGPAIVKVNELQLHLYGDPSINNLGNKKLLLSTIKFTKETQRFSN